jgi:hypothetical protein
MPRCAIRMSTRVWTWSTTATSGSWSTTSWSSQGADPTQIVLTFDGAGAIWLDQDGDLVLQTAGGEVRWQKPVVYQESNGQHTPVDTRGTAIAQEMLHGCGAQITRRWMME